MEYVVKFESLLDTRSYIFNSSAVGACDGKSSVAFILADDRSDSDWLLLSWQGYHIVNSFLIISNVVVV